MSQLDKLRDPDETTELDQYFLKDKENCRSVGGFIEALQILAKGNLSKEYFLNATHDEIVSDWTIEDIDPFSDEGKRLYELGWFMSFEYDEENGNWSYFT